MEAYSWQLWVQVPVLRKKEQTGRRRTNEGGERRLLGTRANERAAMAGAPRGTATPGLEVSGKGGSRAGPHESEGKKNEGIKKNRISTILYRDLSQPTRGRTMVF